MRSNLWATRKRSVIQRLAVLDSGALVLKRPRSIEVGTAGSG